MEVGDKSIITSFYRYPSTIQTHIYRVTILTSEGIPRLLVNFDHDKRMTTGT